MKPLRVSCPHYSPLSCPMVTNNETKLRKENVALRKEIRILKSVECVDVESGRINLIETPPRPNSKRRRDKSGLTLVKEAADLCQETLKKVKIERDDANESNELLDSMVSPLERMRCEMKGLMTHAKQAMMISGAPMKWKSDKLCPFYYETDSWRSQQNIPWHSAHKRAMHPHEWIESQAQTIRQLEEENKHLRDALRSKEK